MNNFGEFLYSLRKEKGKTQAELADALGVTNKAVSKWETGEAMPETSLLLPISRIFGVTVDELLDGKRAEAHRDSDERHNEGDSKEYIKEHLFSRGKDDEPKTLLEKICGFVCATVFLFGVATYFTIAGLTDIWHPYWVIIPSAAFFCAILGIIFDLFNSRKRNSKISKGENPYTGAVCGIIMLTCIIAYLNIGALLELWHPYWIIVVIGGVSCGIIGTVGEIVFHKKINK